jgi:naphthoate synthase
VSFDINRLAAGSGDCTVPPPSRGFQISGSTSQAMESAQVNTSFAELTDLIVEQLPEIGLARITINRPEVRNAFRPQTVDELLMVLQHLAVDPQIVTIALTGRSPSPQDGGWAFCSGGDQRVRGSQGYQTGQGGRLHILEVQRLIRTIPKIVVAVVDGWAAGGGHSLVVVCDLALACCQHGLFKQTDAHVASFDAGYGAGLLARQVGQKRARQIFFLGQTYTAEQAAAWGVVNEAVDHQALAQRTIELAKQLAEQSPTALRMLKYAFNMVDDGLAGQQVFAGEATRLAYGTAEAREGRDAFLEHRSPDWQPYRLGAL